MAAAGPEELGLILDTLEQASVEILNACQALASIHAAAHGALYSLEELEIPAERQLMVARTILDSIAEDARDALAFRPGGDQ